jgi:predicted P-loop ATPase
MYKKADILKEDLSEYQGMDFPYIRTLLMNLVADDEQGYEYLTNWLSWLINNPTQRLATSIVLQGQQGSGKTLFTNYILKKIFDSNFTEIGQEDINDSFSEFMMGKQMVIANEVMYNEKKSGSSEKLKNFVTDDFVNVRRKYRDSLFMRNYCHFIFTSNQQIPIKIEKNDRRFTVFKSNKLPNGVEFYQEFMKVYETEVRAFIEYLRSKEVRLSQVNYPYFNAAKKDIIDASLNSVESFVYDANEIGGFLELNNYYGENYQHEGFYNLLELSKGRENMLRLDSLHRLYQRWCVSNGIKHAYGRNGFTSMLKHMDYQITVAKDDQDRSVRVLKLKTEEQEE